MPPSFTSHPSTFQSEAIAFGSRMEAATEALLRIRNEVVTTLDRQVVELQQMHRALTFAPPQMVVIEEPAPLVAAALPASMERSVPSFFEQAPSFPPPPGYAVPAPRLVPSAAAQVELTPQRHFGFASVYAEDDSMSEATLDPMLEQATLEELNDALASAFAMVSSRSPR